jgi:transposase
MAEPSCPGCRERDVLLAALQERLSALEAEVRELRARLGRNASNSSLPPSANPPQAPPPVRKRPTGRKRGAQPGHPPHTRRRLPPDQVHEVVRYLPTACERCRASLPRQAGPDDPEPTWHQVAELPPLTAHVTEHQGHARACPGCGHVSRAAIPAAVRAHAFGPRLSAVMTYLRGHLHAGQRGVEEVVETVFGVPVSLGTVVALEQEMSQALAPAHAQAGQAVAAAAVKYADETGWKQAGKRCWLWVAATKAAAFFVIAASRGWAGVVALLGQAPAGVIGSDRWSAYQPIPLRRRQVCWAHLKRDFRKCADRGGVSAAIGELGLELVGALFSAWHLFRGGGIDRLGLLRRLEPVADTLHELLALGSECPDAATAAWCRSVRRVERALWTFAFEEGVEPTNNAAERALRPAVLWRKNSFGCHSAAGCRFAERLLTVVQTLRLQGRRVVDYLYEALVAHRAGLPTPSLLPTD